MTPKSSTSPSAKSPVTTPVPVLPAPSAPSAFHLTSEIKEQNVFSSLVASIRDAFFAPKLPPLVLESTPIAVPDRMATKMSRESVGLSIGLYALLILIIAVLIRNHVQLVTEHKSTLTTLDAPPPQVAPAKDRMGGGGGAHDVAPVTKGAIPKPALVQIVPPKAPPTIPPKLAVEPTVNMQDIKIANNNMPNLGIPTAPSAAVGSLGTGTGGGIGSGNGNGVGPGDGGNMGGGVYHIGGGVRPPTVLVSVDPEFSEEARKAKFSGNVLVDLIVDEKGMPSHVRVIRGVGMGLDEKAVEAVRQYRFKPATKDGKPVKVDMNMEINFQIF